MSLSMHDAAVPVFGQMLRSLDHVLQLAEAHATERKIDPAALLQARLFPDMFPFTRQVQIACDFAKGVCARLAGSEPPSHPDVETGFAELRQRIATTLVFIEGLPAGAFEGSEARSVTLRPGTPREQTLVGRTYLLQYGLPQFFFHVTTAYALLRHNGVALGKRDFMGRY